MSALYGIYNLKKDKINEEGLQELSKKIYRQPFDKENLIIDEAIGIGNKLFYTTPESFYEKLPAYNKQKTVLYTVDGRIDNREYLIEKLDEYLPRSFSDTDIVTDSDLVILAYEKWGDQCVDFLIGDFAFVIWDKKSEKLFCGRDRLGVRPFFYYNLNDTFVFASEIYALTDSLDFYKQPNLQSMKSFLYHYGARNLSETMYENIHSLPPGSTLTLQNGTLKIHRYWQPENIEITHSLTLTDAKNKFESLLRQAVECRLRSAYPVGFELSGGLDSSSIVCLADRMRTKQKKMSFSCVYENYRCDESFFIDIVNRQTKMENFTFLANNIDYKNHFNMEFNYSMSPEWPLYLPTTESFPFTELIHKHGIRVVLTGEGGDQVTQGSEYQLIDYLTHFQWVQFYRELKNNQFSIAYIKRFLVSPFLSLEMKDFIKSIFSKKYADKVKPKGIEIEDIFHFQDFESKSFYDDLIMVAGALHASWSDHNVFHFRSIYGIEFRHPFFDSRLVEFTLSLPAKYKLNSNISKIILKEAMKGILPEKIRNRDDKAEFSEIIRDQLRAIDLEKFWLKKFIVDLGIVSEEEIFEAIREYKESDVNRLRVTGLWRLVNLEYWYRYNFVPAMR